MYFTALHRLLGYQPGPITDEMIDDAVAAGLGETADLDWKSELPPTSGLTKPDFPKDIAAMANNGGGIIVYGIREDQRKATGRRDVGELTENHERTLRSAAVTAITPSVFGLDIQTIGEAGNQVVAIVVEPSVDSPHLIYRNEYFGAPIRNDADTVWMNERQLEIMYRARFDERRHAHDALDHLYDEQSAGRDTDQRAWLIAVARPRIPAAGQTRPTLADAQTMFDDANSHGFTTTGISPLGSVFRQNPRPGLRRWISPNTADNDHTRCKEAWASIHHNGSVTLAAAIDGQRATGIVLAADHVDYAAVEHAVADLMALVRVAGKRFGTN
ncbi:ATP-binding protein [Rhodococcus sp. ACPA4]|uniref:ATP-binding protein n=1 Tax=Rhodococcus sp. ACPA4 TaxID=2028571 RepID=UPI00211CA14D|nr:ATP-binding protein [Rhodococcus sp. ACPA4]